MDEVSAEERDPERPRFVIAPAPTSATRACPPRRISSLPLFGGPRSISGGLLATPLVPEWTPAGGLEAWTANDPNMGSDAVITNAANATPTSLPGLIAPICASIFPPQKDSTPTLLSHWLVEFDSLSRHFPISHGFETLVWVRPISETAAESRVCRHSASSKSLPRSPPSGQPGDLRSRETRSRGRLYRRTPGR